MTKPFYLFILFSLLHLTLYSQNADNIYKVSFLEPTDNQMVPSANTLNASLTALGNYPLKAADIATVTRAFAYSNNINQNAILLKVKAESDDLAETLLIFRKRLSQSINQDEHVQQVVQEVFMHYITNTGEGEYTFGSATNTEDLYELLKQYTQSLGMDISKSPNGGIEFSLADRTELCKYCSMNTFSDLRKAGIRANRMRYGRDDVISSKAFDFNGTGYTLQKAAIMADFCNLAYFDPDFIQRELTLRGYSSFYWVEAENSDTEVFLTQKDGYQIVCFRGTNSLTDVITDLKINKEVAFGGRGLVHTGFQDALDEVWRTIEKKIDKNLKIIITGHSLGGALAQLLAHRLELYNIKVSGVYTYGSPRVGNYKFKETYDARLGQNTYLHINNNDMVPTIPFEIMGYKHLGNIERKFDEEHKIELTNSKGAVIAHTKNIRFDQLDPMEQNLLQKRMDSVVNSINASSKFLTTPPGDYTPMTYEASFEGGRIDDHGIYRYLFKLSCAIIEEEMNAVKN